MNKTHQFSEHYQEFLGFIEKESLSQRKVMQRKVFSVFLWCFVAPILTFFFITLLIRVGALPLGLRPSVEWMILVFPVLYALVFLGKDLWLEFPVVLKKGGMSGMLKQFAREAHWREKTCQSLLSQFQSWSPQHWKNVYSQLEQDISDLGYRNRYLFFLSAAVFFMILEGIDLLGGGGPTLSQEIAEYGVGYWLDVLVGHFSQFIALALFLGLLYSASSQLKRSLQRYLICLDLIRNRNG